MAAMLRSKIKVKNVTEGFSGEQKPLMEVSGSARSLRSQAIANVLSRVGSDVFLDASALHGELVQENLPEAEILKICLFTQAEGFQDFIQGDRNTAQSDLDRLIRNAVYSTGLSRMELISLAKDYCRALAIPYSADDEPDETDGMDDNSVYVFPASVYERDLEGMKRRLDSALENHELLEPEEVDRLIQLVKIGIPRAKYYLGAYLFISDCLDTESATLEEFREWMADPTIREHRSMGLALLSEASQAGDPNATAILADYHFLRDQKDDWNEAFAYYTGYGSLALTSKRRKRLVTILNRGIFNKRVLKACIVLLVLMIASVLIAPASALFAKRLIPGIICAVLNAGILVFMFIKYKKNPYTNFDGFPLVMFAVWAAYLFTRLV